MINSRVLRLCVVASIVIAVTIGTQGSNVSPAPASTPTSFAFVLPAKESATFRQDAQLSITFQYANAGKATCRRVAVQNGAQHFELWVDQGASATNLPIAKGSSLRAIACDDGTNFTIADLYITGSTTTLLSAATVVTVSKDK
ncbi:MAG TPA: hypothetical protein VGG22_07910 [Candidatus Baltobacteraceae bacterium]|jgi:hypothetical protein